MNHGLDGEAVAFRTAEGSKLFAAQGRAVVSFEVDSYETARRSGWSVLVKGRAEAVYDDAVIARLERLQLDPWADAEDRPMWVRISPTEITGREGQR